jgi:pimeloyl-ACP methyl ester carboxylesterase
MTLLHSQIFGQGTPMLVLHGLLGMSDNWKTHAKAWAAHYQVHLLDLRNHGRSFHSDDFSYPIMVEDLERYVVHHGLGSFVLLGHSMGGKLAMWYATTHPQRVKNLIVADMAPRAYPVHHQSILAGLMDLHDKNPSSRAEADARLASYVPEGPTRLFVLKNLMRIAPDRLSLRPNIPVIQQCIENVMEALPEEHSYNGPALFVRGENSDYVRPNDHPTIYAQFPSVQIRTIARAGHWLHAENPMDFANEIQDFLGF